ncbi:MAG: hypothetical protein ACXWC9_02440 [Pseudobdellovibrionaceae bacterium]
MKFILFLLLSAATTVWADCEFLPAQTCVEFMVTEILERGSGKTRKMCIAKVIMSSDHSESRVFFRSCPKPDTVFRGNLNQRDDMTLENMATCDYEFKKNRTCQK